MKKKEIALFVAAAITLLAIACSISWSFGFKQGIRTGGFTSSMVEIVTLQQYLDDQFENADCEGVKQALHEKLVLLNKYKNVEDSISSDTVYYYDFMLTHVRLAQIEKHIGNDDTARKHLDLSKDACANLNWQDCSEEKLFSVAEKLGEKHPIACLENAK